MNYALLYCYFCMQIKVIALECTLQIPKDNKKLKVATLKR